MHSGADGKYCCLNMQCRTRSTLGLLILECHLCASGQTHKNNKDTKQETESEAWKAGVRWGQKEVEKKAGSNKSGKHSRLPVR